MRKLWIWVQLIWGSPTTWKITAVVFGLEFLEVFTSASVFSAEPVVYLVFGDAFVGVIDGVIDFVPEQVGDLFTAVAHIGQGQNQIDSFPVDPRSGEGDLETLCQAGDIEDPTYHFTEGIL